MREIPLPGSSDTIKSARCSAHSDCHSVSTQWGNKEMGPNVQGRIQIFSVLEETEVPAGENLPWQD